MRRLIIVLTTCAFAEAIGTMLVQGHADTIKVLRNIVRHSQSPSHLPPKWHPLPPEDVTSQVLSIPSRHQHPGKSKPHKKVHFVGKGRARRHIGNVVVESGQCDHVDLMDCSDFETDEMTCMLTATGMTCCVCTGLLRAAKKNLF
uniref:Secreted protein n=1 Tax=Caenorhabditis japonica TaxID=281687 RepID=A0A8R1IWS9_CAEJA